MGAGQSPRSVARAVACYRGFYRFLVMSGHRQDNPAVDVRAPRAWKTLPKFLSVDEVDLLLGSPDTTHPRGLRDRALIELFYATGLRGRNGRSAPAGSQSRERLPDHDGQGPQQRMVPIGDRRSSWLKRYLRRPAGALETPRVAETFVNARGRRRHHARRLWKS